MRRFNDDGHLTSNQSKFNYRLSRARMVAECDFGRLKGRFRCLLKRNDTTLEYLPAKIASCCILHNICELHSDAFLDEWGNNNTNDDLQNTGFQSESEAVAKAEHVRDALTKYCSTN